MLYKNILTRNEKWHTLKTIHTLWWHLVILMSFITKSKFASQRHNSHGNIAFFLPGFTAYFDNGDDVELYTVMIIHFYWKCRSVLWNDVFTHFLRNCDIVPNTLQWRHNGHNGVSNHRRLDCLFSRLFRRRSKKHQSSASLGFVRGIYRRPVDSPHKGPVMRKMFPFDNAIMNIGFQVHPLYTLYHVIFFYLTSCSSSKCDLILHRWIVYCIWILIEKYIE